MFINFYLTVQSKCLYLYSPLISVKSILKNATLTENIMQQAETSVYIARKEAHIRIFLMIRF